MVQRLCALILKPDILKKTIDALNRKSEGSGAAAEPILPTLRRLTWTQALVNPANFIKFIRRPGDKLTRPANLGGGITSIANMLSQGSDTDGSDSNS